MRENYDKEKIKFLENHLNEGLTKEQIDEMFEKEVIEKDKKEKTAIFQERVQAEAELSYRTLDQQATDDFNVFEYRLVINRPCTLEAFVNLLALRSIESEFETFIEFEPRKTGKTGKSNKTDKAEAKTIAVRIKNGEIEGQTLDYVFMDNAVIEGRKAFYDRIHKIERLVVGPWTDKTF